MTTQKLEKIKDFLNGLNFNKEVDLAYFADQLSDEPDADELYNLLDDQGAFDVEIIYYSAAIKYLAENDPSLRESLELAGEMGYDIENLSSEVLASLLASREARNDFEGIREELDEFFTELNELNDEEDEN